MRLRVSPVSKFDLTLALTTKMGSSERTEIGGLVGHIRIPRRTPLSPPVEKTLTQAACAACAVVASVVPAFSDAKPTWMLWSPLASHRLQAVVEIVREPSTTISVR